MCTFALAQVFPAYLYRYKVKYACFKGHSGYDPLTTFSVNVAKYASQMAC